MALLHRSAVGSAIAVVALALSQPSGAGEGVPAGASSTILEAGNSYLAEGALALEEGRTEEGIRLTSAGLKEAIAPRDAAAAHSNLCGGYALLHQWTAAMEHCNSAMNLDPTNWHTFNNRAAVFVGQGQYELALADLRSGLELAPRSPVLLKSLSIVEHNQRVLNKRNRTFYRS